MGRRVIIVGAGMGGLSAAVRLAAAGFDVTCLEKNDTVGGKLNLRVIPHPDRPDERPFRFDTGPSLLTLPMVFEQLFAAGGADFHEHVTIEPLDPIARFVWADGTMFELKRDAAAMRDEVRRLGADADGWDAFREFGRFVWDESAEMFLWHAPEQVLSGRMRPGSMTDPNAPREQLPSWKRGLNALQMLTTPIRIGMFECFCKRVDRTITHPRLREVLYQYATYSGASPFKAPATLAVIPHAELHFGGWAVVGGMHRLAEATGALARSLGAQVRTGVGVKRLLIERDGKTSVVRGVELDDGSHLDADAVLANSDVVHTYRHLIDPAHRPRYDDSTLDKLEPGGSGLVLLLGVDGEYPQLAHHTKFMPDDYTSDLRAMFETHTVPDDPCIYVCASTRTDASQAPAECENLFVLASAPALDGSIDWSTRAATYRDQLIDTLEHRFGLERLRERIVVSREISPSDLRQLYNANAGSIYGIGSNSRRTAFLRPPNRDRHVRGLYFAGGATHPGGGLPLVTLSGKIASELIADEIGE